MSDFGARKLRLAALAAVPAAIAAGVLVPALAAGTAHGQYDPTFCPDGHVELVNHDSGAETDFADGAGSLAEAVGLATSTAPSGTGSGSGDTVIACHGTFTGGFTLGVSQHNITVRSFRGPHDTTILGDGSSMPIVTVAGRGQTLGGPGLGFTIAEPKGPDAPGTTLTGVQMGVRGAQPTNNEDETCQVVDGVPTASGCDENAPTSVTLNDSVIDNVFTNFVPNNLPTYNGQVTGIEADNTINSTIQQNLFQDMVGDHSAVHELNGIVVGTLNKSAGNSDFETGDSTNINATIYENAFRHLLHGGHPTCGDSTAITLNGFILDSGVINNRIDQILDDNDNQTCSVTGISSNAYGTLENEQTGTLAPANVNIDDNVINQLANDSDNTAIYLAPDPADASPQPEPAPTGCVAATGQNCKDTFPPSSYTVISNDIDHTDIAVDVEAVLGSNSYIRDNNFTHAGIGVQNGSLVTPFDDDLDATNNFWGCPQGPTFTVGSPGGCAAISGDGAAAVKFYPYLHDPVHDAGHDAGEHAGTP